MAYRDDSEYPPRLYSTSDYGDDHDLATTRPAPRTYASLASIETSTAHPSPYDADDGRLTYSPASMFSGVFGPSHGGAYTPVSAAPGDGPLRRPSRMSSYTSYASTMRQPLYEDVHEEEEEAYDLSLIQKAAPMAKSPHYDPIAEEDEVPRVDLTAVLGPTTRQDEDFVRKLQEQEAKGNLTGGLGAGFRPDSRVRDSDLLLSPNTVNRTMSRSFSRRSTNLGRAETIRHMGQDEANRRGEVIEVILEETASADISLMEGPSGFGADELRRNTFPIKKQATQVFYPQPNWKPFSMRWPYLTMLICLSVTLAVSQEVLYQKWRKNPILKFERPDEVDPGIYFSIKFLPTLCAVIYGVLWQFTDFEVRRLEAFYQLSKEGGALASESINVDYVTSFNLFRPFRAIKKGHYAVALSSIATTLAVSLVPTFAAASVILSPSRKERMEDPEGVKEVYFGPVWSRLLSATLFICACAGCGLFYLLYTRRSGLLADVRGIAGLAAMAVVSHILMDFKDMDTVKHKDIHARLKYHRYTLQNSSLVPDESNRSTFRDHDKFEDETLDLSENPHPLMLRPAGCISFLVGLVVFSIFIPIFLFTPADVVTDKAPWVVTALAVALKLCWNGMETAVRMMEPYYILWKRHAPSKTLTLDYTALPFGYMPLRALLNGHFIVFLVGFGTMMAEFLTIMVTSLATVEGQDFIILYKNGHGHDDGWKDKDQLINSGQETVVSFWVSLGLTLFVLVYMTVVAAIVFVRRRHPFLPRQPNTIASVLAFIHQSKMLYDFVGTAKLSNAEMVKKLEDGKTYGLGWFQGRDGQMHCGVDQEELYSDYKHGLDVSGGNNPWNTQWDVF